MKMDFEKKVHIVLAVGAIVGAFAMPYISRQMVAALSNDKEANLKPQSELERHVPSDAVYSADTKVKLRDN